MKKLLSFLTLAILIAGTVAASLPVNQSNKQSVRRSPNIIRLEKMMAEQHLPSAIFPIKVLDQAAR